MGIEAEAERGAVQAALDDVQSNMSELQCQWIESAARQEAAGNALRAMRSEISEAHQLNTCCVCLDNPRSIVLQPCWHHVLCSSCAESLSICPICRTPILAKNRIV